MSLAAIHVSPEEERRRLSAKHQEEDAKLQKLAEEAQDDAVDQALLAEETAKRQEKNAKEEALRRFQDVQKELCTAIQDVIDLPAQANKTHCPDVLKRKEEAEESRMEVMRIKGELKAALLRLATAEAAVAAEEMLLAKVHAREVTDEARASAKKEEKVIHELREREAATYNKTVTVTTITMWSNKSSQDASVELEEVNKSEEDKYLGTWCFVQKDGKVAKLEVVRTTKLGGNIKQPNMEDIPYTICVCGHIAQKERTDPLQSVRLR